MRSTIHEAIYDAVFSSFLFTNSLSLFLRPSFTHTYRTAGKMLVLDMLSCNMTSNYKFINRRKWTVYTQCVIRLCSFVLNYRNSFS